MVLNQNALYYERMASSLGDKARVLEYLKGTHILEIGFGGGELMDIIHNNHFVIHGVDASDVSVSKVADKAYANNIKEAYANEITNHWGHEYFDVAILSSVMHEVFSYGNRHGVGKHSLSSVSSTLTNIRKALKPGGRIVIRDGVQAPNWNEKVTLTMINGDTKGVENYLDLQPYNFISLTQVDDDSFIGTMDSVAAFAYTYTWGEKSLPRESQELFGIMNLESYAKFIEAHGFKIIHKEEYVQQGYKDALSDKILLTDRNRKELPLPPTNAVWVAEKK